MKRYFKIYQKFVQNSLMADLQYRANFFMLLLMNLGWALVYIFLYRFIFNYIQKVGDWDFSRSMVLAATILLIRSFSGLFFRRNFKRFPQLIYQGDLDFILLKPLSAQFYSSLRLFYLRPFIRFVLGWIILLSVIGQNQISPSGVQIAVYLLLLLVSLLIVYSLWFIICCSIFWLGNIENISEAFPPILRVAIFPLDILPGFLKEFFFLVVPLAFMATVPVKALLGLISWPTILYGLFISLFLLFLSTRLWHLGLKTYSSASS
jgi:ABC-2 type transport system permease protein